MSEHLILVDSKSVQLQWDTHKYHTFVWLKIYKRLNHAWIITIMTVWHLCDIIPKRQVNKVSPLILLICVLSCLMSDDESNSHLLTAIQTDSGSVAWTWSWLDLDVARAPQRAQRAKRSTIVRLRYFFPATSIINRVNAIWPPELCAYDTHFFGVCPHKVVQRIHQKHRDQHKERTNFFVVKAE